MCPNHWECWSKGTATFMIAGDRCTRACGFCAVSTAKPFALEADEPERVAEATRRMRLKHVVITAVARDDLADGGAEHFARTIAAVKQLNPETVIEVLTPDFNDRDASIDAVLAAEPHIFNHNLETVRRLTPSVRSRATYDRSLSVLGKAKARRVNSIYTKSGLMLGLGETDEELLTALRRSSPGRMRYSDPRAVSMQPTIKHLPIVGICNPRSVSRIMANSPSADGVCSCRQRAHGAQFLPRRRVYPSFTGAVTAGFCESRERLQPSRVAEPQWRSAWR